MTSRVRRPRALRPGDRIAIVAPASPFDRDAFDLGVNELRTLGFAPVFDESVFSRQGYVAGSASGRATALDAAWRDPTIAGVMAVRGGYGSAQLLPLLDVDAARDARKPFIGSSDLTALLIFLTGQCATVSFHGPMVVRLGCTVKGYDRASFVGCLTESRPLGELAPDGVDVLTSGEASGVLLGGTLTQILASFATSFAFDPPAGYVLFLDDIGERPYRLDRMFTQLAQSGVLARASAVVCAEFPECDEIGDGLTARALVARLLSGFPGPVLFGFPSGHTKGSMITLPFGVEVTVLANRRGRVVIEEAAVE